MPPWSIEYQCDNGFPLLFSTLVEEATESKGCHFTKLK